MSGIDQAFIDAYQGRFEGGIFRVRRTPPRRALLLPVLDEGLIEQGEHLSVVADNGIMGEQLRHGRLVKEVSDTLQKESFLCQVVPHLLKVETHVEL